MNISKALACLCIRTKPLRKVKPGRGSFPSPSSGVVFGHFVLGHFLLGMILCSPGAQAQAQTPQFPNSPNSYDTPVPDFTPLPPEQQQPVTAPLTPPAGPDPVLDSGSPMPEPSSLSSSPTPVPSPLSSSLPDIEAREFSVSIVRHSASKRVYLFETAEGNSAHTGRILLLKKNAEPVMAFRVLKLYPSLKQIAAKRVKRYGPAQVLEPGETYDAIEKISDIVPPPPTAKDQADLKELEKGMPGTAPLPSAPPVTPGPISTPSPETVGAPTPGAMPHLEVKAYDAELDAGSSPPPSDAEPHSQDADFIHSFDEDLSPSVLTVNEIHPFDINHHWFSGTFGAFRNNGPSGDALYFAGGGLRYGYSLGKMLALDRPNIQDSLVAELGVFLYKLVNFVPNRSDAYTVVPLILTLRYNIQFGENLGLFFYGGIVKNSVVATSQETGDAVAALNSLIPAIGTGLLFRVGPNWDARIDLGFDVFGLGLVLRF